MSARLLELARAAVENTPITAPALDLDRATVQVAAPGADALLARRDALRAAGDAAQAIRVHVEACPDCPAAESFSTPSFTTSCDKGRALHAAYRQARAEAVEACPVMSRKR